RRKGPRRRGATADAVARSVRRRRGQQYRSGPGAGCRRGGQRAVHRGAVRLRAREGRAGPRPRLLAGSAAAASRRSTLMAEETVVVDKPSLFAQPRVRIGILVALLAAGGVALWLVLAAGRGATHAAQTTA